MMNRREILIVDDDPRSRKLLSSYLKPKGYDVLMAESGEEALEVTLDSMPAVILLDVMMPGMTGLELCRRIKENPATRLTQIMMVTALGGENDRVEGLDTGADDYIAKPVPKAEFLAKVRSLVRAYNLLEELDQARRDLESRNRELEMKKTLAQTLVHDLKSPLTAVVGNLDLLERKEGESDPCLKRAREGADRMSRMVMDLLDVECLEDGAYEPAIENCDLSAIARESIDSFRARCDKLGIELVMDLLSCGTCAVEADPGLLRRVVDNLLANAMHYSTAGMKIGITVTNRREGVLLAVADQGPGVPQGQREKIFEKYSQVSSPGTTMRKNRGLGLTYCQMAVEAHGGTIWVDEGPEGGARFQFILPELADRDQADCEVGNIIWFAERAELARQAV